MAKTLYGTVSSDKANKTIVVTIRTRKTHPIYKKQYTMSKRMMAHDEKNEAKTGDRVAIIETRPISARKRFMLAEIIERPIIREDQSVEEITKEAEVDKPKPKIAVKKSRGKKEPEVESKIQKKDKT